MSSSTGGFLGRSSTSNSNMRGLVQFIADLRNARARELEEKRINKELANIRQKFKGAWKIGCSGAPIAGTRELTSHLQMAT